MQKEREKLDNPGQAALLILDVFRGQMTSELTNFLRNNNIFFVTVPNNMTHLFQPLNFTVDGCCKSFMKKKFAEWFAQQFDKQRLEDIEMKFDLTETKSIHANWVTQFYNHMLTEDGSKVVTTSWKRSGIVYAVTNGSAALPLIDPFQNITPLPPSTSDVCESETTEVTGDFVNLHLAEDDDNSYWEYEDDNFNRKAFDFIIDDNVE